MNGNLLQQRGDVLRAVVHAAEARRDGLLPTDV